MRLIGRSNISREILDSFENTSSAQSVFVRGYSGSGKSILVYQLSDNFHRTGATIASGKFEQLVRDQPYSAVYEALRSAVQHVLTLDDQDLGYWRSRLNSELGSIGKIVEDGVPELTYLLGASEPVPELGPIESRNRFFVVWKNFIQAFSARDRPLVLFLDDLQWADQASLRLVRHLFESPSVSNLFFIGAYRTEEEYSDLTFHSELDAIRELDERSKTVDIEFLSLDQIVEWVSQDFNRDSGDVLPIAEQIHSRTNGNPFFVERTIAELRKKNLIKKNDVRDTWEWSPESISRIEVTENVVDVLVNDISSLPNSSLRLIQIASSLGATFSAQILADLESLSLDETNRLLEPTRRRNFIVELPGENANNYRFTHDRIQSATYRSMSNSARMALHTKIALFLDQKLSAENSEDSLVFDFIHHLQHGDLGKMTEIPPSKRAVKYLEAAEKSRISTAYEAACEYYSEGASLLGSEFSNKADQDVLYSLYLGLAESEYLRGGHDQSAKTCAKILEFEDRPYRQARVFDLQTRMYTSQSRNIEALQSGVEASGRLGVPIAIEAGLGGHRLPQVLRSKQEGIGKSVLMMKLAMEVAKSVRNFKGKSEDDLVAWKRNSDPDLEILAVLLMNICSPSFLINQELFAFLALKVNDITIKEGTTSVSPFGYAALGLLLCVVNKYEKGYFFGKLAVRLNDELGSKTVESRVKFLLPLMITHWKEPLDNCIQMLEEGHSVATETGDHVFANYLLSTLCEHTYLKGAPLGEVLERVRRHLEFGERTQMENESSQIRGSRLIRQLVNCLSGKTSEPGSLSDASFDEEGYEEKHDTSEDRAIYYLNKIPALIYFNRLSEAAELIPKMEKVSDSALGHTYFVDFFVHKAIIASGLYSESSSRERAKYKKQIKKSLKKLTHWASLDGNDYEHKKLFVEAELARIEGNASNATALFHDAAEAAFGKGYTHDKALIHERAALFFSEQGLSSYSEDEIRKAWKAYADWGATGKTDWLEKRHPNLHLKKTHVGQLSMDVDALIRVMQTLSHSEGRVDNIQKVMQELVLTAKAEQGVILKKNETNFTVEVEYPITETTSKFLNRPSDPTLIPQSVVNYVERTLEPVILDDAENSNLYGRDPFIKKMASRSLLCIPVLDEGNLSGLVLLENRSEKGVFSKAGIENLQYLSYQILSSIVNARLYRDLELSRYGLEEQVRERTAELLEQKEKAELGRSLIEKQARQLEELDEIKTRFFSNLSHEFRTPLTVILGTLESSLRSDEDLDAVARERLVRNGQRMLRLINQLLELARLDAGGVRLKVGHGDIVKRVRQIVSTFRSFAEQKGIELALDLSSDSFNLLFDPDMIEKVLANLLSNALKFTPEGGRITVELDETIESGKEWFMLSVRDTGSGISKDSLSFIFDRFRQVDNAILKEFEGTGIGLSLVKELVTLHQGLISVESEVGEGSTFHVRLPLGDLHLQPDQIVNFDQSAFSSSVWHEIPEGSKSETEIPAIQKDKENVGEKEEASILIVDDNSDLRDYLRSCLESHYKVMEAANGAEGLALARAEIPELIVADVMMPVMDGFAMCKEIKTDRLLNHIPVVLLTAKAASEDKIEGLQHGADDYLYKPFNEEELRVRVANLIALRRQLRERYSSENLLAPDKKEWTSLDDQFIAKAKSVIEDRMSDVTFNVEEFAAEMFVGSRQLQRKLKALTGKTPKELIMFFKMERAKEVLSKKGARVGDLSRQLGFAQVSHFSNSYKQHFGFSPSKKE